MALIGRKIKGEAYAPTDWVYREFHHLCPEGEAVEKQFYLNVAGRVAHWLGPLNRPVASNAPALMDVLLLVAGHSMQIMEGANFRAWTAYYNLVEMQRAVFLRSMLLGAGTFTARHVLERKSDGKRWTPLIESGGDFFGKEMPARSRSKVTIGAIEMEQAIFHKLLGEELMGMKDRMAMLAAIGSFDNNSDDGNPVTSSLKRGLRKALLKYQVVPTGSLGEWLGAWHPELSGELAARVESGEMVVDAEQLETLRQMPSAQRLATSIGSAVEAGKIKVSCPGAPFHGISGQSYLVWPAAFGKLADEMGWVSATEIEKIFREERWLEFESSGDLKTWRFDVVGEKNGKKVRKARMRLVPLTAEGVKELFGEGLPRNSTIDPDSGVDTDTNSSI